MVEEERKPKWWEWVVALAILAPIAVTLWLQDTAKTFRLIDGYCKKCGKREVPIFSVSDDLWFRVTGHGNKKTYCINCFDKMAREKGIYLFWGANP